MIFLFRVRELILWFLSSFNLAFDNFCVNILSIASPIFICNKYSENMYNNQPELLKKEIFVF
jgi:hypothetical protein